MLVTGSHGTFTVVIRAVLALADPWKARSASLETDTVKLATHATFAVAPFDLWLFYDGLLGCGWNQFSLLYFTGGKMVTFRTVIWLCECQVDHPGVLF